VKADCWKLSHDPFSAIRCRNNSSKERAGGRFERDAAKFEGRSDEAG